MGREFHPVLLRLLRRCGEDSREQVSCQPNCCRGPGAWLLWTASRAMAVVALLSFVAVAAAREPAEEFVAGLRERGLQELALEYLDRMQSSALADDEFRRRIGYHRGLIFIDQARQTPDRDERATLFVQARNELDRFVAANPDSAAGAEALAELANVLVEQGKLLVAEAGQLPEGTAFAGKRGELLGGARREFDEAVPRFQQAARFYSDALDKLPKSLDPKTQSDEIQLRQDYRGRLAQVSVLAAQAEFEKSATYPKDAPEFRELHEQTAKQLAELHDQYSRWLVGLYARLYEGRCYQAVGDYTRALGCYEQLIGQSSVHPAFRKLIASAYGYQAECMLALGKYNETIVNCTRWLNDARTEEATQPEWLMVRYRLAEAQRTKSQSRDTAASQRRRLTLEARDNFRVVANSPGEYQAAARIAAAQLGPADAAKGGQPRDFKSAYDAGKEAMASVNAAKLALPSAEINNPAAIPALRLQMQEGTDKAREQFRYALALVDDDTDLAQLNEVRYFLCWLYWESGDFYQAAVLGDFLARRYPDHPAAAAAAKLALASYDRLQTTGGGSSSAADADFESRKMAEVAEFITRRWPDTQAAETAFRVLASYAIRNNRIDDAKKLLDQVSPAARPSLEAQLGNAMWTRYLELSQKAGATAEGGAQLTQLRDEAVVFLRQAFEAARKSGKMTEVAATAGLYLVQAALGDGNDAEAIMLLEEPKYGPLALIASKNVAAARPEFQIEVYKSALRAYVSASPPQAERAIETMKRLEAATTAAGVSADQLTRVYVSLAVSLDEQIQSLRAAGRAAEADRVSAAFAEFLKQISARQDADAGWPIRSWIAQTYYKMGENLQAGTLSLTPQAKEYFTAARDAYRALVADAEKDPSFAPSSDAVLAVRKQLGDCYRQLGEYQLALDTFSAVLKDREAQLTVQQAAAQTYQAWGEEGNPKWLERAIYGGYQVRATGKNRIWGWLKLALVAERAARSNPSYREVFFDARLQAARCRYLVGLKTQGADREHHLATAKQSIRSMLALYPDLGGSEWRGRFESLLKEIQRAAGEQPAGLQEFASATP